MSSIVNNATIVNASIIGNNNNQVAMVNASIVGNDNDQTAMNKFQVAMNVAHMGSLYSLIATAAPHPNLPPSFTLHKNVPIELQGMDMAPAYVGASTNEPNTSANSVPSGPMKIKLASPSIARPIPIARRAYVDTYVAPSVINVRMVFKVIRPNADLPHGKSEIRIFPGNGRSHLIAVDDDVVERLRLRTMHEPLKKKLVKKMENERVGRPTQKPLTPRKVDRLDSRSKAMRSKKVQRRAGMISA
ncbi:Protein of unknown function [Pyronema omphalodes CBS 100304]|uniref:Uncharacterized protein n=1 Tax=Pyronema omphalodes (strain CBS 100304) TaxID=1076935 RepID=U4LMS5_PYROM|nr:Protein of unknown function [Pyronema omphalodes CBS 100304]